MTRPAHEHAVMIVEDDLDTRDALCVLLAGFGYQTVGASDGGEALALLRNGSGPRPCLILLDVAMRGMDGWAFHAEQQRDPEIARIPVAIVTADLGAEKRAVAAGVAAFLAKPLDVDALLAVIRALC